MRNPSMMSPRELRIELMAARRVLTAIRTIRETGRGWAELGDALAAWERQADDSAAESAVNDDSAGARPAE